MRMTPVALLIAYAGLLVGPSLCSLWAGDFDSWSRRIEIQFAGYERNEVLTNFPALVLFEEGCNGFHYADMGSPSEGSDLRFTDETFSNALNFQIDQWTNGGVSYVWVQVPALTGGSTKVYAYYGKAGQTLPSYATDGSTWSNGFAAVWHLSATSGNFLDSTTNSHDGTDHVTATGKNGIAGPGQEFEYNDEADSDYIDWDDPAALELCDRFSMECWFNVRQIPPTGKLGTLLMKGSMFAKNYDDFPISSWINSRTNVYFALSKGDDWIADAKFDIGPIDTGRWYHMTGVYEDSQFARFYLDGALVGSSNIDFRVTSTPTQWRTGRAVEHGGGVGTSRYDGFIDEIRMSRVVRSSNWVWSTWMTVASNRAFTVYSDPVVLDTPAFPSGTTLKLR